MVGIRVFEKETNKRVFKQDVFVAIVGQSRAEMGLEESAEEFYQRFDLEAGEPLYETEFIFGRLSNTGCKASG